LLPAVPVQIEKQQQPQKEEEKKVIKSHERMDY
jgi:hypothetical protein